MILSLQGCMAVGKTTAVRYLQANAPYINISYEINTDVVEEVKRRNLDKNVYEDYLEIQKLWLRKEVVRYEKAMNHLCSVMDFGAEEIEFYTLNYPESIGVKWEVENALKKELDELRGCMPDRILFLDAADEVLRSHKEHDSTRSRNFFEHHLTHMLPLKRKWFIGRDNVDLLRVDELSAAEVGLKVKEWCDRQILTAKIKELKIQPVGDGFIDMICPPESINELLDLCNLMGLQIAGFSWWCHVTGGHEPCGMGGPKSEYDDGWFSEIPMDKIIEMKDNEAYRTYFSKEWPKAPEYRECYRPGFWLKDLS